MTALDNLTTSASVARDALAETRELTEVALDQAYQKTQHAAALGVHGVAATIQAAHHQLEAVASSLHEKVGALANR